ncbi:MAG: nitrogen fixation protein NifZ [Pseudomonadota bacterium]
MSVTMLKPGDVIYAGNDIHNDGSLPELPETALLAKAGARGVLVNIGEIFIEETEETRELLLARFEGEGLTLGPPIGCWPDEVLSLAQWEARISAQ